MASEYVNPDAVACIGVSHHECYGAVSLIARDPIRFRPIEWLSRAQIGDDVPAMLPKGSAALDARAITELDEWFGPQGMFPAVKITSASSERNA
jgi:hypothetical protein